MSSMVFLNDDVMFFNVTSPNVTFPNVTFPNRTLNVTCTPEQQHPQHALYHLANICYIVSYLAPRGKRGLLFMHSLLILGFFLFAMWAWNIVCSPNIFSWNFFFVLLNLGQVLQILYSMRKVKLPLELEDIYRILFQPLQVSRLSFQKLVSPECAQMLNLHPGEAYAMQGLTRTDRLGLLIKGKANVISGQHFLHQIQANEFLDSPEFESSRSGVEEKFKVSIIATTPCRAVVWQRQSLEYLLIKETHLSNILALLLSTDITKKLYSMNDKMVTEKGSHLDIRLPSFTGSIASHEEAKKVTESVLGCREFVPLGANGLMQPLRTD
ncbi:popeye domain-containing protein 3 [Caerostris darwini]|uniref:Popeye domain-containing protein 3 n=1 Tax=Caerostris darwini TaxID=1538125 RepID=A0AAV4WFQ9_9ARAC|nr:popeye domain-containing protein 3 [Caerostris darwini]